MLVAKKIGIDAAHFLPGHKGKCKNVHGHHWVVEVGLDGPVGKDGMVVDFSLIKTFLLQIRENLDHHLLNDIIENPTAENLAKYVKDKYFEQDWGFKGMSLKFIRVWETEDSYALLST